MGFVETWSVLGKMSVGSVKIFQNFLIESRPKPKEIVWRVRVMNLFFHGCFVIGEV